MILVQSLQQVLVGCTLERQEFLFLLVVGALAVHSAVISVSPPPFGKFDFLNMNWGSHVYSN